MNETNNFIPMVLTQFENPFDLTYALFNEIGLYIGADGYVYDRDTNIMLRYNNKQIKASIDINNPAYPAEYYTLFDINDSRLMTIVFGYYLEKESSIGNYTALTYWSEEPEGRTGPSSLSVKSISGEITTSKLYYNKALKYSDIILRLGGYNVDLNNFDREWMIQNDIKRKSK